VIDLSICLPAIRPGYWVRLYNSFVEACTKYSFELVFISPYDLPDLLKDKPNIKHLKSYATSVRSAMEGSLICEGRLIAVPADDGHAFPGSLDASIELMDKSSDQDAIVLRYRESNDMKGPPMPLNYWTVQGHRHLLRLGIPPNYKFFMQPLMSMEYFKAIGGWDCRFEHLAYAAHDLSYRIQRDGGNLHLSPLEVMNCSWTGGKKKKSQRDDHAPIRESMIQHDEPLFNSIYSKKTGSGDGRTKINFDNWKQAPEVWHRRWPNGVPK